MFASAKLKQISYNRFMREHQTTGNPNVVDLFVVVSTCLVVLLLVFPLHADGQPCVEVMAPAVVVAEKAVVPADPESVAEQKADTQPVKSEQVEQKDQSVERSDAEQITVDVETLKTRLKETDAIGVFTKLAIRSDILDLVDEINRHRKKNRLASKIAEMRASFDGLLLKMVALLERDPTLSRDLYVSRESIWKSLLEVKV